MYIRRTTIKSRRSGEPYYTYRLVESVRTDQGVRQRTLVNLGRHFDVPQEQWAALAQRIEQLLNGQQELFPPDLDPELESTAQRYAATGRVSAHLFISVLAYHLVHTIRYQLKASGHRPQLGGHSATACRPATGDRHTQACRWKDHPCSKNHSPRAAPAEDL